MTWTSHKLAGLAIVGGTGERRRPATGRSGVEPQLMYPQDEIVAPGASWVAKTGVDAPLLVQRLWVPAIAPSINGLYTMHAMTRSSRAKSFKALVVAMAHEQRLHPVDRYPVKVHVVCHFGPGRRQYDAENLALSAKWAGDGLRDAGILRNDSPAYISSVTLQPMRTDRESYMEYFINEDLDGFRSQR
jgi:hypothetical protein